MADNYKAPKWLVALSYTSVIAVFGFFIGAALYSQFSKSSAEHWPSPVYIRLVSGAIVSLGAAIGTGLLFAVFSGSFYSGIARRRVSRERDAIHFWLLLTIIGLIPLALIVYGVYKLVNV